jgi:hypothetical protein
VFWKYSMEQKEPEGRKLGFWVGFGGRRTLGHLFEKTENVNRLRLKVIWVLNFLG